MEQKRSDGILVLGVMAIIFGIWSLLHILASNFILIQSNKVFLSGFHSFELVSSLIIYPLFIVGGYSVLKLKNWGRILLIFISTIQFIIFFLMPFIYIKIMNTGMFIPTPIPVLYMVNIWYFNRKLTREQFNR